MPIQSEKYDNLPFGFSVPLQQTVVTKSRVAVKGKKCIALSEQNFIFRESRIWIVYELAI